MMTPDTEWAKAQSFMHALHANLLLELQNPTSDTAIEQAARRVLQGARDVRTSLHSFLGKYLESLSEVNGAKFLRGVH